jgi:hypothetical protein
MVMNCTKYFRSKAFQNCIFGMQIYHLATLNAWIFQAFEIYGNVFRKL